MTVLAVPGMVAQRDRDTGKTIVSLPFLTTYANNLRQGPGGLEVLHGGYSYYVNALSTLHTALLEDCDIRYTLNIGWGEIQGRMVLSHDKQHVYVCCLNGSVPTPSESPPYPSVYKVHIESNAIVWTYSHSDHMAFNAIAIDSKGDIFAGGESYEGDKDTGRLIKISGEDGSSMWSITCPFVGSIAVDASDNIYATIAYADLTNQKNVYHFAGSDGEELWGISTILDYESQRDPAPDPPFDEYDHKRAWKVVIDSTGRVFVTARQYGFGAGENCWYELDPADGGVLQAGIIGYAADTSFVDMIVRSDDTILTKCYDNRGTNGFYIREWSTSPLTEITSRNWPVYDSSGWFFIKNGPLKTVFALNTDGYEVYRDDGSFVIAGKLVQTPQDMAFPCVKAAWHVRPSTEPENYPDTPADSLDLTERQYRDMPSFIKPDIAEYDRNAAYAVDDVFFYDSDGAYHYSDQTRTGTYKVLEEIDASPPHYLFEVRDKIEKISESPPCEHPGWDQFEGYGGEGDGGLVVGGVQTGIGNSPQFYTAILDGLLADGGGPSPYNGKYILPKGPGLFGFFYHFNLATGLHILFNIFHLPMRNYQPDTTGSTRIRAFLEPVHMPQHDILGLVDGDGEIVIAGDQTTDFVSGVKIKMSGTSEPANNIEYDVTGSSYEEANTTVTVDPNSFADEDATGGAIEIIPGVEMIYKFSANVSRAAQIIAPSRKANDFLGVDTNVIAWVGVCSLYPGKIEQWDAVTVWAVDRIVAGQERFYKAINPNQNSEPPSGDWVVS